MLARLLAVFYRNLRKDRTKILNIFSIAITLAFVLLILFFVEDELSYDRWNVNLKNIYRVATYEKWPAKKFNSATSTFCIGPTLKGEFPEINTYVRFIKIRNPHVVVDQRDFKESHFYYADSSLFDVFPYELVAGSREYALSEPNSMVLTEELAEKYFNRNNPVGSRIRMNGEEYTITGIIHNIPNSHLKINAVVSLFNPIKNQQQEVDVSNKSISNCGPKEVYTYILTYENIKIQELALKLPSFYEKHLNLEEGYEYNLVFEPLAEIHFSDDKLESDLPTMNRKYISIFEILLLIILVFSIINYINLMVGKSVNTGKYIGLHKLYGIRKREIFTHFIFDSLLNTIIATVLSVLLLIIILPRYNEYFDKSLSINVLANQHAIINIVALWIILGALPGIILSLIFMPIKPLFILKNQLQKRNRFVRKVFVFLEISLLTIVVFGIILVNAKLFYLKNTDLGFNKEDILILPIKDPDLVKKANVLKNAFRKYPGVLEVAVSDISVGDDYWVSTLHVDNDNQMESFDMRSMIVDEDFCDLYQIELASGRTFSKGIATDINNCLINEAALLKLGLGSDAIDRRIRISKRDAGVIIGMVKNFYFTSKHNAIEPLFIYLAQEGDYTSTMSVKLASSVRRGTIRDLKNEWNSFSPNEEFNYSLAEDKIKAFYSNEERLSLVLMWATILSFLIVGFGLICFILFIIEQRTKEISIRKVNGASSTRIVKSILLNEFLFPAAAAILVIFSLSQLVLERMVKSIVTDLSISWWTYIATIVVILLTLILTTVYQLYKAANRNPLEILNSE